MSKSLSDYNNEKGGGASNVVRKPVYADLNLRLSKNLITEDVRPIYDIDAVKNSVRHLLVTNNGDRLFHPEIGSNITKLLFEPADELTATLLKDEIRVCLARFERRVEVKAVDVIADSNNNTFYVNLKFLVIPDDEVQEVSFYLDRLR
jgi:phage baseplate assembly protein W